MPTINDYKKSTLKTLTGSTGDINTLEYKWLRSVVTPYKGSIPDMWKKYLTTLGYTTGALPNRFMKYLGALGYTGSLNKRWYNYWKNGGGYSAEASALFARITTPPSDARKVLINNLIVSLKTAGVWAKLDAFYVLAAADAQSSLLNWVSTSYNLTAVNSPTFVIDRHYVGDGSTSYLSTGFNPTTAVSPKFTQNSGALFQWSRTDLPNGAAQSSDFGQPNAYIARSATLSARASGRPLAGSGQSYGDGGYPGFASFSRTAAAVWEAYAEGVDSGGGTTASAAPTNDVIRILSISAGNFGLNQIAVAGIASGLSAAEELATYNAINTYLVAVGAA